MKKILSIVIMISLMFGYLSFSDTASAYPGGLLEGKVLNVGPGSTTSNVTTNLLTDNDETTYYTLPDGDPSPSINDVVWIEFDHAKDLTSYKLKVSGATTISFFDVYGGYTDLNANVNGVEQTIDKKKIIKVGIQQNTGSSKNAYEWDVFGYDSTFNAPTVTGSLQNDSVILNWGTVVAAPSYTIKRAISPGGPYEVIASGVTGNSYTDVSVIPGANYYYVVTTVNGTAESANSNEVAIEFPTPTRAILNITMTNGFEKEFDLSTTEVNAFLAWYDAKDAGTGPARYAFTKTWNQGPFKSRTEYVIFDKILTFEVNEYDVVQP